MADPQSCTYASPSEALRAAVVAVGGQAATARLLGVSQPSVWRWLQKGEMSPKLVRKLAEESGVPKEDIAPDIFPRDAQPSDADGLEPAR